MVFPSIYLGQEVCNEEYPNDIQRRVNHRPQTEGESSLWDLPQPNQQERYRCLHSAIRSGDSRIVELFLDYYQKMALNINIQDSYGNILARFPHSLLLLCCLFVVDVDDELQY